MATEQEMENIGDPVYTDNSSNPLRKLMEGFCSPSKMMASNHGDDEDEDDDDEDDDDDDDDDDRTADKYAPDLAPYSHTQIHNHEEEKEKGADNYVIGLTENNNDQDQNNGTDNKVDTIKSNSPRVISELLTTDGLLTNDTSKVTTNPSPTSPDTTATTTTTTTTTKHESRPEIEVSKRVTMMRRKRGIENVIMAFIFVLTTLLSLKKFGFTTSDVGDFISIVGGGDNNNNNDDGLKSWIHIFDKKLLSIEKGKIKVKKTATTTTTEEQPSIDDETETPPESVPAVEEKDKNDEEEDDTEDDYDSYDDDDEEKDLDDDPYYIGDSYEDISTEANNEL